MVFKEAELELVMFDYADIVTTSTQGDFTSGNAGPSGGGDGSEHDPFSQI